MFSIEPSTRQAVASGAMAADYASLLDALPDAVFIHAADTGRILEVNLAGLEMFGYTPEGLDGIELEALSSGEPGYTLRDAGGRIQEALEHGRAEFRWRSRRADGSVFWSEVRLVNPGAETGRVIAVVRDLTDRDANEAALKRITRLYAALSLVNQSLIKVQRREELFEGICRALVEGGGFWAAWIAAPDPVTQRFEPLASYGGRAEWLGGLDIYATGDRPEGQGTMGVAYREERPVIANDFDQDARTLPWRVAGRSRDFRAVASFPVRDGSGRVFGVLCIYARETGFFAEAELALLEEVCNSLTYGLEDLAKEERRRLAEAEQRSLEARLQQTQKMESLGNLAGGVAHDMNNVLGAVMGLASIERERAEPESPAARSMETIVQACSRGRELVQGLLCFARHDLGEHKPVDLNRLVAEVVGLLSHTTLQRIQFHTDLDPDLLSVEGDSGALNLAFMNICVNALDAMPEGGSITVRTRNGEDGTVTVEFQDTGVGMPPEVMERATEPFFTTKPAGKGTGLGLAMAYGTVQAHRGTLALSSQPGLGTRVRMVFPGSRERPVPVHEDAGKARAPGLSILLIDDDEMLRESISDVLTWQGHRAEGVPGGQEGLARLAEGHTYDLVILDLNMPGLSGHEVLPRLLAMRPDQRVLISSGYSDGSVKDLLEGRPNVRALSKPFTTQELDRKIREF